MAFSIYSATKKGFDHVINEDSFHVGDKFTIIADGMGGEASGDIASNIAVNTVIEYLNIQPSYELTEGLAKSLMLSALTKANENIENFINLHPDSIGMGTTALLSMWKEDEIYLIWCGDSRGYLLREGKLYPLTKDHSYVQELIDDNKLTIEESFSHPDNNLITRYLGGNSETFIPEFLCHTLQENDMIILCSDGLSGYCRDKQIENYISKTTEDNKLPKTLLNLAIDCGSYDDITVIVMVYGKKNISPLPKWLKALWPF